MIHSDDLLTYLHNRLDDYLTDLRTLVALDSFSADRDDVNRVVDWLDGRLRALNYTVERLPQTGAGDDLHATRRGSGAGKIVLLGHSDTVFPRGTAAQRPLSVNGDTIMGPGTCDMKGGLLVGLYALEALHALGCDAYEQITYLCVSDEETDNRHSIPLIRVTSAGADAVLTLEAARANGDVVTARKGVCYVIATAYGHSAHAGVEPEKGCNAIVALMRQALALHELNDPANGITVNVGRFEGGRLPNVVPDRASMKVDLRAFTPVDLDRLKADVQRIFEHESVPGVRFSLIIEDVAPPMPRTEQVIALERLTQRVARELGFTVRGAITGGGGDASYAAQMGTPVIDGLGPIGGLDHGPDEYILKSSIVPRTALLAKLIVAIGRQARLKA